MPGTVQENSMQKLPPAESLLWRPTNGSILERFLDFDGSTTFLLQQLAGRPIKITVLQQWEEDALIRRISLLSFAEDELPLIYSTCLLDPLRLHPDELALVRAGTEPLGRLLDPGNQGRLRKQNITVRQRHDAKLAVRFRTRSSIFYTKRYDLMIDHVAVGNISESLNEESLWRASRQYSAV